MSLFRSAAALCVSAGTPAHPSIGASLHSHESKATEGDPPCSLGPRETTLAMALRDYVQQRAPSLNNGDLLRRRLHRYLRHAPLATGAIEPVPPGTPESDEGRDKVRSRPEQMGARRECTERRESGPLGRERPPRRRTAEKLRERLAHMTVADVTRDDIQQLMDALRTERLSAHAIASERAILRAFFSHAKTAWNWAAPENNPATRLDCRAVL
ncbi:hypothetical protein QCE62_00450 [Caballeronia sp. LZ033]|uniref:hypothetical protein n=1 Tax=Caballeronia sp. LZ033 TaxID=3038566 RepID=UPI0028675955|nr:hypothetical protein [Caballeronia sp. LZ033]MDR5812056.1 hypothetical protein [Caballeronia sp. LZ033]